MTYRLLRRIQLLHVNPFSAPSADAYGEWQPFGTRNEMALDTAREIARCLRAIAVDQRYQYAVFDADGCMVEDERGTLLQVAAQAVA
jgi:hypothetical protein